jgi:hypothetical protein|tara:strand:- start:354 stop:554 length:201 start_codon:yes stop_codon:yes gene_type:complete
MGIKYDSILGFIDEKTQNKVSQDSIKLYAQLNPMEVKVGEPKLTKLKAPVKMIKKGVKAVTTKEGK